MKLYFSILFLFIALMGHSQDPFFYNSNTLQIYNNPAFSGLNKSFSLDFGYRNQWPELSGNYVSSVTSFNQFLGKGNGVSIQVFTDNAAKVIHKTEIDLGYAKTFKLVNKHFLSLGVQFAYYQKHFNFNNLTFGDMIDPRRGFVYSTGEIPNMDIGNFDAHIGLVYYNEVFYVSLSSKHLLRPIESFYDGNNRLPILYFTEVGGKYQLNDFRFVPLIRLRVQDSFTSVQAGLKTMFKKWFVEGGYHFNSGFYGGLGYLGEHIKAGYNLVGYNLVGYNLSGDHHFAHELFLGCNLNLFKKQNEHFFDF